MGGSTSQPGFRLLSHILTIAGLTSEQLNPLGDEIYRLILLPKMLIEE